MFWSLCIWLGRIMIMQFHQNVNNLNRDHFIDSRTLLILQMSKRTCKLWPVTDFIIFPEEMINSKRRGLLISGSKVCNRLTIDYLNSVLIWGKCMSLVLEKLGLNGSVIVRLSIALFVWNYCTSIQLRGWHSVNLSTIWELLAEMQSLLVSEDWNFVSTVGKITTDTIDTSCCQTLLLSDLFNPTTLC